MNNFLDIYGECLSFLKGKISKKEILEIFSKIEIRNYIPIDELFSLIYIIQFNDIVRNLDEAETSTYAIDVEVESQLIYLACKIGSEFDKSVMTNDFYDVLFESGLIEYVANTNRFQYDSYISMIRRAVDINAVGAVGTIADKLNLHSDALLDISKNQSIDDMAKKLDGLLK